MSPASERARRILAVIVREPHDSDRVADELELLECQGRLKVDPVAPVEK
jgi:hypothetical protein